MKRSLLAAAGIAAVLLLAGCSAPQPEAPSDQATVTVESEKPAAPAQVAPSPTATDDVAAEFLASGLVSQIDLSDDEKIAAAKYACDQVAAGNMDVVALEGVTEQMNRFFVIDSLTFFCPELSAVYAPA